jgi:RHS repeat-associated protein
LVKITGKTKKSGSKAMLCFHHYAEKTIKRRFIMNKKNKVFNKICRIILFPALLAALLVIQNCSNANSSFSSGESYIGAVYGRFNVSNNGGAVYNIPIRVPPGTNKVEPKLAIIYNSKGGNGMMGMGFRLNGMSIIKRVPATWAQDKFRGTVNYDENDRFDLDGQRLINITGVYGADSTIYHTESESWKKVISYGSYGSGPEYFKVYTKKGQLMEYGNSDWSRAAASNGKGIRVWALNKITDLNGNYIEFKYHIDKTNGSYYPLEINYTGNKDFVPRRSVRFAYEPRTDITLSYKGGAVVKITQRLKQIVTYLDDNPVLIYKVNYQYCQTTGRSLLASVTQCDGNGNPLSPTSFSWQQGDPAYMNTGEPVEQPTIFSKNVFPMDVNGDGIIDIVSTINNNQNPLEVHTFLSDGTKLTETDSLKLENIYGYKENRFLPMDVNGDGMIDLVYGTNGDEQNPLKLVTFISNGKGFCHEPAIFIPGKNIYGGGKLISTDIDGDGRIDLLYALNNGASPLKFYTFVSDNTTFTYLGKPQEFPGFIDVGHLLSMDYNGDSMADIVYATSNPLKITIFKSNGKSYDAEKTKETPVYGVGALMAINVNGDNNMDLVYTFLKPNLKLVTYLSNGKGFEDGIIKEGNPKNGGRLLPADVNGDRLTDFVFASENIGYPLKMEVYLSDGQGFQDAVQLQETPGINATGILFPMDFNGDAKTDIIHGLYDSTTGELNLTKFIAKKPYPGLIEKIDNGIGGSISVEYKPLTDPAIYTKAEPGSILPANSVINRVPGSTFPVSPGQPAFSSGTSGAMFPIVNVQFPVYAVADYTKSDGRNNNYKYSFKYGGAKVDKDGRGWLGFQFKTLIDTSLNTRKTTYYKQLFPFTNLVDSSTLEQLSDEAVLTKQNYTYQRSFPVTGSTKINLVLKKTKRIEHYTYGRYDYTRGEDYEYDAYGSLILHSILNDIAVPDTNVYVHQTYDNDTQNWQLGYLRSITYSGGKEPPGSAGNPAAVLKCKEITYYPKTWNIKSTRAWDDSQNRWITQMFTYDRYGNKSTITSAHGAVTNIYYDEKYNTFPVQTVSPPNKQGLKLVYKTGYNYAFGVKISHTDPNGNTITKTLDGLGRILTTSGPDPSGKMTVLSKNTFVAQSVGYYTETRALSDWAAGTWHWVRNYTDGLFRAYKIISQGDNNGQDKITDRILDSKNRVIKETLPYFAGSKDLYWTETVYDPYDRIVSTSLPQSTDGNIVTKLTYDGKTVTTVKAFGTPESCRVVSTHEFYNGKEKTLQRIDEKGAITRFKYDLLGKLILSTDPGTIDTGIIYNTAGRKIELTDVSSGKINYFYDDLNMTIKSVYQNKDYIHTEFDNIGRMSAQKFFQEEKLVDSVTYQFDLPGYKNSLGRLSKVTMANGSYYEYHYDAYGNIETLVSSINGKKYTSTKTYTPNHKIKTLSYPDGSILQYNYTPDGHLSSIAMDDHADSVNNGFITFATFTNYSALGKPGLVMYGNKVQTSYSYDTMGHIDTVTTLDSQGKTLLKKKYERNYLNRIKRIQDLFEEDYTQVFTYDEVGRLVHAEGKYGTKSYAYDNSGNITLKDGITFSYNNYQAVHGTKDKKTVFSAKYDQLGNMRSKQFYNDNYIFDYDVHNRLKILKKNGSSVYNYEYDYTGRRTKKIDLNNKITTIYVSPLYEVTVLPGRGQLFTKYIPGPAGRIASVSHSKPGAQTGETPGIPDPGTIYFHQDHVNSTKITTDSAGLLKTKVIYAPYGKIFQITGPDNFRPKFGGKELDEISGLYYFGARYYDPDIARFITADTRLGGHLYQHDVFNRYAYTLNNPVNYTDPSGHGIFSWIYKHIFQPIGHFISKYANQLASLAISGAEIVAGAVLDVVGDAIDATGIGAVVGVGLDVAGGALMGAGIGGLTYTATHFKNFSWKNWGIQEGVGAAIGAVTAGLGDIVSGGGEAAEEAVQGGEEAVSSVGEEGSTEIELENIGGDESIGEESGSTSLEDLTSQSEKTGCFVAGTKVFTNDKLKNIEKIKVGDMVWSYNEKTGKKELNKVVRVFKRAVESLIVITVNGLVIETTAEHPFNVNGDWIPASKLKPGDILTTLDERTATVEKVTVKPGTSPVFNFEVDITHNYYITGCKVLVHNLCEDMWYEIGRNLENDDLIRLARNPISRNARNGFQRVMQQRLPNIINDINDLNLTPITNPNISLVNRFEWNVIIRDMGNRTQEILNTEIVTIEDMIE